jgi:CheY-like chemotaxis protein
LTPSADVVITDLAMPDADGYALLRALQKLGAERGHLVPVIALTGSVMPEDRRKVSAAGFAIHLTKPVGVAELLEAVAMASSGHAREFADNRSKRRAGVSRWGAKLARTQPSTASSSSWLRFAKMDKNSRQPLAEVTPNWPQLLSKTTDDLSRIARTEMELLVAKLGLLLEAQTDKITGVLFLIVALSYGSLVVLGGIVRLIDLWLT